MNVLLECTTAMKTLHASIMLDHLAALALPVSLEMEPIVKIQMNVLWETTIAIKTQRATILMDHLVAPAIPASPEMEPIVKTLMNARMVMIVPLMLHVLIHLEASIVFAKLAI